VIEANTILIAANTTWYVYNFRRGLITALIKERYNVVVFSPNDDYVSHIHTLGAHHIHLEMNNVGTNPFLEFPTLVRIGIVLRSVRPDAILTYTPKVNIYFSLVARLLRIPVIANISGLGYAFGVSSWLRLVTKRLYKVAMQHPGMVFFQNEDDRTEFVRGRLVERSKARRIPGSGVDLERFKPLMHRKRDAYVFLLAARLLWEKGIREYVEAARRVKASHPFAEFRLLGFLDVKNPSAVPRADVERWHAEGIISYQGVTENVVPFYADADCVVLPSYYREGVPRSLLEAASMEIPLITTDWPGCRDAVEDGLTGFLCKPKDTNDLAACMTRMLSLNEERRRAMGIAGRRKMQIQFDERAVVAAYIKAIGDVTQRKVGIHQ
jgi:glycosyltransferase involved in cell wall biosynthesis